MGLKAEMIKNSKGCDWVDAGEGEEQLNEGGGGGEENKGEGVCHPGGHPSISQKRPFFF